MIVKVILLVTFLLARFAMTSATNCTTKEGLLGLMATLSYTESPTAAKPNPTPKPLHCSAIILNPNWLLSLASCLFDFHNPSQFQVQFKIMDKIQSPIVAKEIIRNPSFNNELGAGYDLALIKVDYKIPMDCVVNIPDDNTRFEDKCLLLKKDTSVANSETFKSSDIMVQTVQQKGAGSQCIHARQVTNEKLVECGNVNVCEGQSGAVIVCPDNNDQSQFFVRDLSSWADSNCATGQPYLFTKVSQYYKWISSTISQ